MHCSGTPSPVEKSDLDCRELTMEMRSLPDIPKEDMMASELLTFINQNELCELYPNLWIVLRISCSQNKFDLTI